MTPHQALKGSPVSVQATHQMEDNWPAWSELAWGIRTGGLTFNKSHNGLAQFPYFQANPAQEDKFSKAMASVNHLGMGQFSPPMWSSRTSPNLL
jgi:hypothetical protein